MDSHSDLIERISALRQEVVVLMAQIVLLKQENAELHRRLGLDCGNSSKPPSSDGLQKKPRIAGSLRGHSGKANGGQVGHKGDTLRQVAQPDHVEQHHAEICAHCRAALDAAMQTGMERRQVFDVPQPRLAVTEHQAVTYRCTHCQGVTKAAFPADVTAFVQYGPRLRAAAVDLNTQQLIPEDRVCQALADLFATTALCPASVTNWVGQAAMRLADVAAHIAQRVAQATVNRNRRLAKDVEATIASAEAFLYAASAIILLRRLAR